MDAAGAAKLVALDVLANTDVPLIISLRWVDPWWGSSLVSTIGPDGKQWSWLRGPVGGPLWQTSLEMFGIMKVHNLTNIEQSLSRLRHFDEEM